MDKVVEVKVNKMAVTMIVVGMTIELGVMAWLLWPRKVR